jgi:hypothetical protein
MGLFSIYKVIIYELGQRLIIDFKNPSQNYTYNCEGYVK